MIRSAARKALVSLYRAYRTVRPKTLHRERAPQPHVAPEPETPPADPAEVALEQAAERVVAEASAAAASPGLPLDETVLVFAEPTPNPNAMKFTATRKVVPRGSISFASAAAAQTHPLGKALFAIDGVRIVFAVNDFVTVTKDREASWADLVPAIEQTVSEVLTGR